MTEFAGHLFVISVNKACFEAFKKVNYFSRHQENGPQIQI